MKIFLLPKFWVTLFCTTLSSYLLAATFTVSTLAFTGPGSIDDIITMANATAGPHIINFSVMGTITATTLMPIITEDLTINGDDIVIDGAFSYQIFDIASSSTTVINDLTVMNALAVVGAAISNRGSLTLNNVTLTGNRASDRGGAIYNQGGDLTINNSLISNNNGGNTGGGGIFNTASGSVSINNSTITGNFTFGTGGGVFNAGTLDLTHTTIAANSAFATVNGGGGVHNSGSLTMNNNIVYSNTIGFFGTPEDIYSATSISTPNPNLVGICAGTCPTFPYTGNPLLSALADNGGSTHTMALLSGSPAIDAGGGGMSEDQREFDRDASPDLGAYEFGAAGVPVELLSFDAELMERDKVRLHWLTASELENEGFEIERSTDTKEWETIAFVKGFGTTTETQSYKYIDASPFKASNYYRLKQLDTDGTHEYSHIVEISLKQQNEWDLLISPNPVRDVLYYQLLGDYSSNEDYHLTIYNILGIPVQEVIIQSDEKHQLFVDALPNGSYFVLLRDTRSLLLKKNIVIVR